MKNIIIYGIGKYGRQYVDKCISSLVEKFILVDSDSKLWGQKYKGIVIQKPDDAFAQEYEKVIITVSDKYKREVYKSLVDIYNVPEKKIAYYEKTIVFNKNEIYNMGNMEFKEPPDEHEILTGRELYEILQKEELNKMEKFFFEKKHNAITKWLHYFEAYENHFFKYKGKDVSVLEIGVFKGGSLQLWKDYFQGPDNRVKIFGVDINPDCKVLEEDNIKIFIGSQEDRDFLKEIKDKIGKVDIIIDDGGHTMSQQITAFEELFDLVDENGVYLCEDIHTSYMGAFGGKYKGNTFVEYSKNLIDFLHAQYSETNELIQNKYTEEIKSITYYDSMMFINKKKRTTRSIDIQIENR